MTPLVHCLSPLFILLVCCGLSRADWPAYRGAQGDAVWRGEGAVAEAPDGPLDFAWRTPVGLGYAGPAVADGRVFVTEYEKRDGTITNNPGGRDRLEGTERTRCLDAETGEELWRHEIDRPYFVSYPGGPRATPTVDGDRVYTLGAEGNLFCLRVADGSVVWSLNFAKRFGSPTPQWGHSAHPLVEGDLLYVMAGGEEAVAVALDKLSGDVRWASLSTPSIKNSAGYCPPTMWENAGRRELIVFHPLAVEGLDPATGESRWRLPIEPDFEMSINAPQPLGDGAWFVSGHGGVSVCFRPPAEPGGDVQVLWSGTPRTSFGSANVTAVVHAGLIYGCDTKSSALVGVNALDGTRAWETTLPTLGTINRRETRGVRHGTAFPVRVAGTDRYWLAAETGDLILARLTAEGYEELGRQPLLEPTGTTFGRPVWWSHPAFSGGSVYARNDREIVRVDLSASGG